METCTPRLTSDRLEKFLKLSFAELREAAGINPERKKAQRDGAHPTTLKNQKLSAVPTSVNTANAYPYQFRSPKQAAGNQPMQKRPIREENAGRVAAARTPPESKQG